MSIYQKYIELNHIELSMEGSSKKKRTKTYFVAATSKVDRCQACESLSDFLGPRWSRKEHSDHLCLTV